MKSLVRGMAVGFGVVVGVVATLAVALGLSAVADVREGVQSVHEH
jgi:hypothetical protein